MSQTHTAHGERIDRLTGITRVNALFVYETRPQERHFGLLRFTIAEWPIVATEDLDGPASAKVHENFRAASGA